MGSYKEWIIMAKEELQDAITSQDSRMNDTQKELLPTFAMYQQERIIKQSRWLIGATWVLVGFTIILAVVTYLKI